MDEVKIKIRGSLCLVSLFPFVCYSVVFFCDFTAGLRASFGTETENLSGNQSVCSRRYCIWSFSKGARQLALQKQIQQMSSTAT